MASITNRGRASETLISVSRSEYYFYGIVMVGRKEIYDVVIGVDANVGGYVHRAAGDRLGVARTVEHRPSGGERVIAAGTDRGDGAGLIGLRLQHVAGARQHQADILVGDQHHRLQSAQIAVHAPILGEFDAGPGELTGILFELGFEPLEQREGVGGRAGEAGDHVALAEPSHFFGVALHDGLAEAHLTVAGDDRLAVLLHHYDGGCVPARRSRPLFLVHSRLI